LLSAITEFPLPAGHGASSSLTVGPDGNLWFAEGSAIGRITPAGTLTEFPLPTAGISPGALTVGPDGNLWFPEDFLIPPGIIPIPGNVPPAGKIGRITPAGALTEFPVSASDGTLLSDLIVGHDGNLWFTESVFDSVGPDAVGRITPSGAVTAFPLPSTEDGIVYALTVGSDGNLWFPEFHESRTPQKIGRITPTGTLTEFRLPARYGPANDLTVGPDGDLWFTVYTDSGPGAVGRITPAGALTEFTVPTAADTGPSDLTVGPDGDLWFSAYPAKRSRYSTIDRITPAGAFTQFRVPTAGIYPGDLTVGPDDNLWFTTFANSGHGGVVGRITPAGAITEFSVPTAGIGPGGLTVGPDGNLWFPENFPQYWPFSVPQPGKIGRIDPTPPRVTGALAVTNSRKAITSILLGFDEALDPGAAERVGFYSLTSGVERGHQFVFSKGVKIARVSYDATARTVALELARPQKRTIRVTVRDGGLLAADGLASSGDSTAVVA
jgi:streptogramin lyase